MTLSFAGAASAQSGCGSGSGSGSGSGASCGATTTTTKTIKSSTLGRTGIDAGMLLIVGGGITVVVLGARRLARASVPD